MLFFEKKNELDFLSWRFVSCTGLSYWLDPLGRCRLVDGEKTTDGMFDERTGWMQSTALHTIKSPSKGKQASTVWGWKSIFCSERNTGCQGVADGGNFHISLLGWMTGYTLSLSLSLSLSAVRLGGSSFVDSKAWV
ncbi:unnamed protein product [Ectocarpus sp. 12 AP-2014]